MPTPDPAPQRLPASQGVYLWLTAVFVTCLLIANITGSKFFHFGTLRVGAYELPIEHSVGMFAFPVTFLLTDLLNEYFGARGARRVTYIGLAMSALAVVLLRAAIAAPPAAPGRTFVDEGAFSVVLGASGAMIFASMVAYLIGQLTDITTFTVMKRLTGGRLVWLRATGSTIVSQAVDSLAIMTVIYILQPLPDGSRPTLAFILAAAAKGYTIKFLIAVGVTPLIYLGRWAIRRFAGLAPMPVPAR